MKNMKRLWLMVFVLAGSISFLHAQSVEMRKLAPFTKVHTGGSWDVVFQKGDQPEVKLESRNLDLDKVITEVKNNTLKISLERGNYRNVNLKVYVTYTDLNEIKSGGSGNVICNDELVTPNLNISLAGSGNGVFKNVNADELQVSMSGSGNVKVGAGNVGQLSVRQSGSGDFNGMDLLADEVEISKSGSGNASVSVNGAISVRSSGSGNVYYAGNPEHKNIAVTGSGKLVKR